MFSQAEKFLHQPRPIIKARIYIQGRVAAASQLKQNKTPVSHVPAKQAVMIQTGAKNLGEEGEESWWNPQSQLLESFP